jgi:hypothetical protein
MLSSCCDYSLNATNPLRSKNYPTIQICIVEVFLQWCVETLYCSLIPLGWKPDIRLNEVKLLNLLGRGGPQVKVGH